MTEEDIIKKLEDKVEKLELTLRKISTLNSLGKTLQIEEIIIKALNE